MRRASSTVSTFAMSVAGIDVDEGLAGSIKHLEAARYLLDLPGRRGAARGHGDDTQGFRRVCLHCQERRNAPKFA